MNNITDACAGNVIPADSTANFTIATYITQDIGGALPAGGSVPVAGGYDIQGGGTDIGGTNDQFRFTWQQRAGDFDVKVRVASLGLSDSWAEAGLMAREALVGGSRRHCGPGHHLKVLQPVSSAGGPSLALP